MAGPSTRRVWKRAVSPGSAAGPARGMREASWRHGVRIRASDGAERGDLAKRWGVRLVDSRRGVGSRTADNGW